MASTDLTTTTFDLESAHRSASISRRTFFKGVASAISATWAMGLLPKVEGGYLAPAVNLTQPRESLAAAMESSFVITVVSITEVGIHVVDVSPLEKGMGPVPVSGATVTITSHFVDKSVTGITDEEGKIILDIADLAETDKDGKPIDGLYQFNGSLSVKGPDSRKHAMRDFSAGLVRVEGANGLKIPMHALDDKAVYIERLTFDDWDIHYSANAFYRSSGNTDTHSFVVRLRGASKDTTVTVVDLAEKTWGKEGRTETAHYDVSTKLATATFKGKFLQDGHGDCIKKDETTLRFSFTYNDKTYSTDIVFMTVDAPVQQSPVEAKLAPMFTDPSAGLSASFPTGTPFFSEVGFEVWTPRLPFQVQFTPTSVLLGIGADKFLASDDGTRNPNGWRYNPKDYFVKGYQRALKKQWNEVKDTIKNKGWINEKTGKLDKHQFSSNFDASVAVQGVLGLDWEGMDDKRRKVFKGALTAAANLSIACGITGRFMVGPVPVFVSLVLDALAQAAVTLNGHVTTEEKSKELPLTKVSWSLDDFDPVVINLKLGFTLSAGVGVAGVLAIGISGSPHISMFIGFLSTKALVEGRADPHFVMGYEFKAEVFVQLFILKFSATIWSVSDDKLVDNWENTADESSLRMGEDLWDEGEARFMLTQPDGSKRHTFTYTNSEDGLVDDTEGLYDQITLVTNDELAATVEATAQKLEQVSAPSKDEYPTLHKDKVVRLVEGEDGTLVPTLVDCPGAFAFTWGDESLEGQEDSTKAEDAQQEGEAEQDQDSATESEQGQEAATEAEQGQEAAAGDDTSQEEQGQESSDEEPANDAVVADAKTPSEGSAAESPIDVADDAQAMEGAMDAVDADADAADVTVAALSAASDSVSSEAVALEAATIEEPDASGAIPAVIAVEQAVADSSPSADGGIAAEDAVQDASEQEASADPAASDATDGQSDATEDDDAVSLEQSGAEDDSEQGQALEAADDASTRDPFFGLCGPATVEYSYTATGSATFASCAPGRVKGIADHGGIVPTTDVVINQNVYSDPRQKAVVIAKVPYLFRIVTVEYPGPTVRRRTRLAASAYDVQSMTWGEPQVIEYGSDNPDLPRVDVFDYDYDIVARPEGAKWFKGASACVIVTGGMRPNGDGTSVYEVFTNPTVTILFLDGNLNVVSASISSADTYLGVGSKHMVLSPRVIDRCGLNELSGVFVFAFIHRSSKTAESIMSSSATVTFTVGYCHALEGYFSFEHKSLSTVGLDSSVTGMDMVLADPVKDVADLVVTMLFRYRAGYDVYSGYIPANTSKGFSDFKVKRNVHSTSSLPGIVAWPNHGSFLYTLPSTLESSDQHLYQGTYSFSTEDASDLTPIPVDIEGFKGGTFGVSPNGSYLYFIDSRVGNAGDDIDPQEGTHTKTEDVVYRIRASKYINGKFCEDFEFSELTHPVDSLSPLSFTSDASTFIASQIIDADKSLARLHYISVPHSLVAEVKGFNPLDSFVCAGKTCQFQVDVHNHGNVVISGFDVELVDGDTNEVVSKDHVGELKPEKMLLVAESYDREASADSEAVFRLSDPLQNGQLMPGKSVSYTVNLDIPSTWGGQDNNEGKKTVIVRISNAWASEDSLSGADDAEEYDVLYHPGAVGELSIYSVEVTEELVDPAESVSQNTDPNPDPDPIKPSPSVTPSVRKTATRHLPETGDFSLLSGPLPLALGGLGAALAAYGKRREEVELERRRKDRGLDA